MRLNWSRMKRSALGAAFAATCISSLQFSGCLKNSARDLSSSEISKEATKAALEAEKEIDERRQKDALIASKKEDSSEMKLSSSTIEKELAISERNESPLTKFLRGKNNPQTKADPFLVADAPEKEAGKTTLADKTVREEETLDQLLADKTKRDSIRQTNGEAGASPKSTSVWDDLIKEHLDDKPVADASTDMPAQEFLAATSNVARPSTSAQSQDLAGNAELPEWARSASQDPTKNEPATDDKWDSLFGVADATQPKKEPLMKSVLESAPAQESVVRSLANAPTSGEDPRERINTLLMDAHTQEQSGDLQAAYRSALMAEAVAIENGIRFAPQEEAPAALAQTISDKIWGKPAAQPSTSWPQEQPAFSPRSTQQPVVAHKQDYDQVFQADSSFPEWKALPPKRDNEPASFEQFSSPTDESYDLRNFRSENTSNSRTLRSLDSEQGFPAPSFPSTQSSQSQQQELRAPLEAAIVPVSSWETPVIAQGNFRDNLQLPTAQANAPLTVPSLPEPVSVKSLTLNPPILATNSAVTIAEIPLDQSSEWNTGLPVIVNEKNATASVNDETPGSFKWGILGILAAIASTIIGLKLARSEDTKTPAEVQKTDDNSSDDQPQFRIRHAA